MRHATDPPLDPAADPLRPRDFVEASGLFAAVTSLVHPEGPVVTPRYRRDPTGLRKLSTAEGDRLVREAHPSWWMRSSLLDAEVAVMPWAAVEVIHRPSAAAAWLASTRASRTVAGRAGEALRALAAAGAPLASLGVTGSLLVGAGTAASDIDVVCYGRAAFAAARSALRREGGPWAPLTDEDWRDAWLRRGAPGTFEHYVAQERDKGTKALIGPTRLDLSLVQHPGEGLPERPPYRRLGRMTLEADVLDDAAAFDYPARYLVDHPVGEVVSYTATYTGQARRGDRILADGWLEACGDGGRRLLVGTSREAQGEAIRRLGAPPS